MNKLILTDIDGVCLNWVGEFRRWMHYYHARPSERLGHLSLSKMFSVPEEIITKYIFDFNTSLEFSNLPPLKNAQEYIKKLRNKGYKFHAITAIGIDERSIFYRNKNIRQVFGFDSFDKILTVDYGASKRTPLLQYEGSGNLWVEDNLGHAKTGLELGMESILMTTESNINQKDIIIPRFESWKEIYEMIQYREELEYAVLHIHK